jgi:hypothetical protein
VLAWACITEEVIDLDWIFAFKLRMSAAKCKKTGVKLFFHVLDSYVRSPLIMAKLKLDLATAIELEEFFRPLSISAWAIAIKLQRFAICSRIWAIQSRKASHDRTDPGGSNRTNAAL